MFDTSSLKYVYSSTLGENFQIYGVQNTGKLICQSNIYFVPIDKPPPPLSLSLSLSGSYHQPPSLSNTNFEISFSKFYHLCPKHYVIIDSSSGVYYSVFVQEIHQNAKALAAEIPG